ncbi:MAG: hypothetical protein ABI475_00005, partial [Methylophilaceae bacterium]
MDIYLHMRHIDRNRDTLSAEMPRLFGKLPGYATGTNWTSSVPGQAILIDLIPIAHDKRRMAMRT